MKIDFGDGMFFNFELKEQMSPQEAISYFERLLSATKSILRQTENVGIAITSTNKKGKGIYKRTGTKTAKIVEFINQHPGGVTIKQISEGTGFDKKTTQSLLSNKSIISKYKITKDRGEDGIGVLVYKVKQ